MMKFLFLMVREEEKQNPSRKKEILTLTPPEDGFLKLNLFKGGYAYA
jgi:hypothetical protein